MTQYPQTKRPFLNPWRLGGWGILFLLLSLPAVLRFPWSGGDFVVMGIMLASVGGAVEFLFHRSGTIFARLGALIAVVTCFLTIWVNLAVGMIGSEDNPYNQLFLLPIAIFALGGFITRLRTSGMARVLFTAAAVQFLLGLGGYADDPRGGTFSMAFSLLWLFGAALFRAAPSR